MNKNIKYIVEDVRYQEAVKIDNKNIIRNSSNSSNSDGFIGFITEGGKKLGTRSYNLLKKHYNNE
jgi:hypothetical protein